MASRQTIIQTVGWGKLLDHFNEMFNELSEPRDPYYNKISKKWSLALKTAFNSMPNLIIKGN
tara:strand:- start:57 stop:242 length:186 start_codon:yes stop_codon:yes gene_type:complete